MIAHTFFRYISIPFAILLASCNSAQANPSSTCQKNERVIFSCNFANGKTALVCTNTLKSDNQFVEYRFGKAPKVEMTYRADQASNNAMFHSAEVLYASNAEKVFWFKQADFAYLIHMPMRGGPSLEVMRKQKTVANLQCLKGWSGVRGDSDITSKHISWHGKISDDELFRTLDKK